MTDASDEVKVGVWRALFALGSYRFTEVIWPEVFFAAVIGGGGSVAVVLSTILDERIQAVGSLVAVSVGLLAVVFASLAIVVALPASSYLMELGDTPDGGMRVF